MFVMISQISLVAAAPLALQPTIDGTPHVSTI
jgi:hypothetical protein